jgi:hypothetical protein
MKHRLPLLCALAGVLARAGAAPLTGDQYFPGGSHGKVVDHQVLGAAKRSRLVEKVEEVPAEKC